jgi:hypothetical protein
MVEGETKGFLDRITVDRDNAKVETGLAWQVRS